MVAGIGKTMYTAATLRYIWEENKSSQNTLEAITILKKLKICLRQSSLENVVRVLGVTKHLQIKSILHYHGMKLLTVSIKYKIKKQNI